MQTPRLLRIFKILAYREYATILENTCASNLEPFGQALNDYTIRKKYFFDNLSTTNQGPQRAPDLLCFRLILNKR